MNIKVAPTTDDEDDSAPSAAAVTTTMQGRGERGREREREGERVGERERGGGERKRYIREEETYKMWDVGV